MELLSFEQKAQAAFNAQYICGCDEAGRGPLAGPVVAAAVYIPQSNYEQLDGVKDSKQLTARKRVLLFDRILQHSYVGLGILQAKTIDEINIYEASRQAMHMAIRNLSCLVPVDYILTDAMPLPGLDMPYEAIIKGDQKSLSIAAASIIAKQVRDQIMIEYDTLYPSYGFAQHKGYGTKQHVAALTKYGIVNDVHRLSYKPVQHVQNAPETV